MLCSVVRIGGKSIAASGEATFHGGYRLRSSAILVEDVSAEKKRG
jgi:hypothetical protein